ncbi:MAG: transglutaminase domain-containing protein, partial [Bacteroidetes bacterium]|nr:transglutaminase domain-containing protein [Bacteroidota bacterium]
KPWYFQEEIPVLHSEVRVDNFREVTYAAFPQMYEVEPYRQGRYRMRHIKALEKGDFTGNWNDYRAGLRFQMEEFFSLRTEAEEWRLINMDLQQGTLFLDDSATQDALYSLTQSLTRDAITDEEKVSILYNHVRKNVRWNQKSDTWMTKTPSRTYKDQEGNSVEINMLLTQMLWLANLDAYRLFYRTREKGLPSFYPIRNQFNDMMCIVEVDGQTFLLDATDPLRPYDLIPKRALNRMGWMIKDSTASWVKIPQRYSASLSAYSLMSIHADGNIHGECKETHTGYQALEMKKKYKDRGNQFHLDSDSSIFKKFILKEIKGITEPDLPVTISYNLESNHFSQKNGDTLKIAPLLHYKEGFNPFQPVSRSYPVDFGYIWEKTILLNFLIPEGYQVAKIPENIRV